MCAGRMVLQGLTLFRDSGLVDTAIVAIADHWPFATWTKARLRGFLGGFSAASAGLLLFAIDVTSSAKT